MGEEFYGELGKERYLSEVRRFVPGYDFTVEALCRLVKKGRPKKFLDIGAGVGNIPSRILEENPESIATCLEPSKGMAEALAESLEEFNGRSKVLVSPIETTALKSCEYDFVLSNLVLHNVSYDEKLGVLRRIKRALVPGGIFLWGDLVRYSDPEMQEHTIRRRKSMALAEGADPKFVEANFRKEKKDYMLTLRETLSLCSIANFRLPHVVWHEPGSVLIQARK